MLKKFFTNQYVIVGIIVFVLLFVVGLYLKFSLGQTLLASVILAIVGIAVVRWQEDGL